MRFSEVSSSRVVNGIALLFSLLLALAIPIFFFLVKYGVYNSTLQADTEIRARVMEERIERNPQAWEFELLRVQGIFEEKSRVLEDMPRYQKLQTMNGHVIAESNLEHALAWPTLSHSVSLRSVGVPRATLEQAISLRPLLFESLIVGLFSLLAFGLLMGLLYMLTFRGLVESERKLNQMAWFDPLTSLPNRAQYKRITDRLIEDAEISHKEMAVYFIDLDHFKPVNDTRGHHVGDALLKLVAQRIRNQVSKSDIVMRFGGDEFVVVANNTHADMAMETCEGIVEALTMPFVVNGQVVRIGASAGISLYPQDAETAEQLLSNADIAMYQAKQDGRGQAIRYSSTMRDWLKARKRLEEDLRVALEEKQFHLVYQPVHRNQLHTPMVGVEALLRWERKPGVVVPPNEFIAILEESGHVGQVGDWVIEQAIKQLVLWDTEGKTQLTMSVNIAASQLEDVELPVRIAKLLLQYSIDPARLKLEFTESALIADTPKTRKTVEALHQIGVGLEVDDFGTGYSSFIYLKRYAITGVKVDRSFVKDMLSSSDDRTIVKGIIRFAHDLNLTVTAEGVEHEGQVKMLRELGCDYLQGYYFSKPVSAKEIEVRLVV